MAPRQIALPVSNFRTGRRTRVRLLALHTTEGALTMASLAAFQRRMGNSSYHAGSDDDLIAYMVNRSNEAWHLRNGNPMADGFVMCAFARWSEQEWLDHPTMLENCAWWLASCARERGLPLRHLTLAQAGDAVRNRNHPGGVIAHWDYTRATSDGTHWDCGSNFPWTQVLTRARAIQGGRAPAPGQPAPPAAARRRRDEENSMQLPPTDRRIDGPLIPTDVVGGWAGRAEFLLAGNSDGGDETARVHAVYAIINRGSDTPPRVEPVYEGGGTFPQWWPGKWPLPDGTTGVLVNYTAPSGMAARVEYQH